MSDENESSDLTHWDLGARELKILELSKILDRIISMAIFNVNMIRRYISEIMDCTGQQEQASFNDYSESLYHADVDLLGKLKAFILSLENELRERYNMPERGSDIHCAIEAEESRARLERLEGIVDRLKKVHTVLWKATRKTKDPQLEEVIMFDTFAIVNRNLKECYNNAKEELKALRDDLGIDYKEE